MTRNSTSDAIRLAGGLLPSGLLDRVGAQDPSLEAAAPSDYHLAPGERLGEAITRSWNRLRTLWERFAPRLEEGEALTGPTRQEWLLPLFQELGFGHLAAAPGFEVGGKAYPISHLWETTPLHLVGIGVQLDRRTPGVAGAASASPHGLLQEFLNRSDEQLWGIVSNGRQLRMLRDNSSLTRTAYVEFDLRAMFASESFSDFALLWLTCHASRFEGPAGKQVLERWREDAAKSGIRALDALRDGVETAIKTLGSAAVGDPANLALRRRLASGSLDAQDLYRQILRVVYRILFLLVAEGRNLLLDPSADPAARHRYYDHYSITRLRRLSESSRGGAHGDLWRQHNVVAAALEARGEPALALLPLGGFLWSSEAVKDLADVTIPNQALLDALRALTTVNPGKDLVQRVDYANLGAEELGSIYESLLEYTPEVDLVAGSFELRTAAGNERKTTGSYYTPTSLINELLNSALDPVVDEATRSGDPERAILDLKVVDPAAGSGHFLIAAAHRIADRLARVRAGDNEPSPDQLRTALRDVIGHCIYAVDINPMAVELAKVALWIEAMEPGKPLTFLDHHIVCGNSLLGVTPKLLEEGIPDDAYKALTGDDKDIVKALISRNKNEREKRLVALNFGDTPKDLLRHAADEIDAIDHLDDTTVDQIAEKQRRYQQLTDSDEQRRLRLAADAWVAAFVTPKTKDSPQITTATFNAALHDPDTVPADLAAQIDEITQRFRFHHWHLAFPHVFTGDTDANEQTGWAGGFDVVLSNPPWEHTELKEKEWFGVVEPAIARARTGAIRKAMIARLERENPALFNAFQRDRRLADSISLFARASGVYPLTGRGRINMYALFAELGIRVKRSSGFVGLILPTGVATDHTTQEFFKGIVEAEELVSLFDFENHNRLFAEVAGQARFSLLTIGNNPGAGRYAFLLYDPADLLDRDRIVMLSAEDIGLINPNTGTVPILRSERDAEIARRVYRRFPVLRNSASQDPDPWEVVLAREFNMTSDSGLFLTERDLEEVGAIKSGHYAIASDGRVFLPLFEAKMGDHFDHRAADVIVSKTAVARQGQPRKLSLEEHRNPTREAIPRYWVSEADAIGKLGGPSEPWLLTFREITAATNQRTMIPTLIPWSGVGYKSWIVIGKENSTT